MAFRVFICLLVVAAVYAGFEIVRFKAMFHSVQNPRGEFQVLEPENASLTLVEFIDYNCPFCKEMHPAVKSFLDIRKDVRYVARPIVIMENAVASEKLTRVALAAGMQGKFWEFHDAFLGYPRDKLADDKFIRETAALYNVDYDKMVADSNGEEVEKMIDDNSEIAAKLGIFSTPTLIVGETIVENMGRVLTVQDLQRVASGQPIDMAAPSR